MIGQFLVSLLLAFAILWMGGSLAILAMRPWRHFDREDRWFAWAILFGWPIIAGGLAASLLGEWRADRRDARGGHGE